MRSAADVRPLAIPALAVTALGLSGAIPVWPGSPHQVALPPLDLFADVRVLLAEAPSYPLFAGGLLAVLAARTVLLAMMLRVLHRDGLVRAAQYYLLALPVALVAGGLAYAGVAAVYSLFLWVSVALTTTTLLVFGPHPWRDSGERRSAAKLLAYFAGLLTVSLVSTLHGTAVRLVLVWVSAALTAATISWLRRGRSSPASSRGEQAAASLAGTLCAVMLVAVAAVAVSGPPSAGTARAGLRVDGTLFVVPGIGGSSGTTTMFGLDPVALGYDCSTTVYFSYAGPGGGAPQRDARCPIRSGAPYRQEDTRRPVDELVRYFRVQYAELEPPVVVAAHSQGGWVAAAALGPGADVESPAALVLLGAFPGHRIGYRLDETGAGVAGTDALEVLAAMLRGLRGTTFDPGAPLTRELLGTPGAIDHVVRVAASTDIRVVTVTSAFDLPIMSGDRPLDDAVELCPFYVDHGGLPSSSRVLSAVRRALDARTDESCAWWRRWPAQAFGAFGIPTP